MADSTTRITTGFSAILSDTLLGNLLLVLLAWMPTAAVIIARAHTGRQNVLSDGYHGWHPEFQSLTPPHRGCQKHEEIEKLGVLEQIDTHTAAVIVEPIVTDYSMTRVNYLRRLREACTKAGAVLIFDEVISGFRVPTYSVAQATGVIPDLICVGKAIGGGLALSVVGGSLDLMLGDYFVSSTFAGETLSLAAALEGMKLLQSSHDINRLWAAGGRFITYFNKIGEDIIQLQGYATRAIFVADPKTKALFFQEACRAGILVGPSFFFNFCHIELADEVLATFQDIILRLKTGSVELRGQMPRSPFAERVRGNE